MTNLHMIRRLASKIAHSLIGVALLAAASPAAAAAYAQITAPTTTNYVAPASFTVSSYGEATADGERLSSLKITRDGTVIASKTLATTTGTLSAAVSGLGAGTYYFQATTTTNRSSTSTATLVVTVTNPGANPPSVSLGAITGAPFNAPASLGLSATASDSDGSIAKVEFYSGATLLATTTAAPYAYTWSNVGVGTYSITAKAYDNTGNVTTSAASNVTVSPPPGANPPTVSLGAITGSPFIAPANLGLSASAADSDGSIVKVEFYAGGALLATTTAAPYAYTWSNVGLGTYSITAKAYDNTGNVTTSAPSSVTVAQSAIVGNIEDVRLVNGTYQLLGWACSTGRNQSVDVHVYVGGPAGTGTFATATTASLASEPAVASSCQASGTNYRFSIPLTAAMRQQFASQKIYVHGISPVGGPNSLINTSGVFSMPSPLSISRRYVYDSQQRVCKVIEPETGATVMDYDAAGNVLWSASGIDLPDPLSCNRTEALNSGRVVNRTYDARNRLSTLRFPNGAGDQDWQYTKDNLPSQITTNNSSTSVYSGTQVINAYAYNERRLLTGESSQQSGWYTWSAGYTYNQQGQLRGLTYPSATYVDYAPNALGQPTSVVGAGTTFASSISYYPNGSIKQFAYGNGVLHTMTQNTRQLPSKVVSSLGVLDYDYAYDKDGNITSIADNARGSSYSRTMAYDALDRLTEASSPSFGGNGIHTFTYDAADNLRSWTLGGVKDYANYIYDASNRLTSIRNSAGDTVVGMSYDAQGNLSNKNGQDYVFDFGNRLRSIPNKEDYRYDGLGRRVLDWSPTLGNIISMYSQQGQLLYQSDERQHVSSENIYLAGSLIAIRELPHAGGSAIKYQHTDALGSPVAVTNASGAVIDRTAYEPYGAAVGKPSYQGIGYSGHVMDGQTGLTYMQQRYYDPSVGRFLSADPVAAEVLTGRNFGRYKYGNNNPYSFIDPDGRQEATAIGCAVTAEIGCAPGAVVGAIVDVVVYVGLPALVTKAFTKSAEEQQADADTDAAVDRWTDGATPAPGKAGQRGELTKPESEADADWERLGATPGATVKDKNNIRMPNGDAVNRHRSTKPYKDGPPAGTDTIKYIPKGSSVPGKTVRYLSEAARLQASAPTRTAVDGAMSHAGPGGNASGLNFDP